LANWVSERSYDHAPPGASFSAHAALGSDTSNLISVLGLRYLLVVLLKTRKKTRWGSSVAEIVSLSAMLSITVPLATERLWMFDGSADMVDRLMIAEWAVTVGAVTS
jgi:hypothetical protein